MTFQSADGGFGLYDSSSSGVDTTAMALQGLANYRNRPAVKTAIDKALDYLRGQMRDDFGYGTSEATAKVLLALVEMCIRDRILFFYDHRVRLFHKLFCNHIRRFFQHLSLIHI